MAAFFSGCCVADANDPDAIEVNQMSVSGLVQLEERSPVQKVESVFTAPSATPAGEEPDVQAVVLNVTIPGGLRPTSLGLSIDETDDAICLVQGLEEDPANSLIAAWNSTCNKDEMVKVTDCIIAVNGKKAKARQLRKMLQSVKPGQERLVLTFLRSEEKKVRVTKSGKPIGVALRWRKQGLGLAISEIEEVGAVISYNETAPAGMEVHKTDRIVAVDGETGTPLELMEKMKSRESFELGFLCWADPDSIPDSSCVI